MQHYKKKEVAVEIIPLNTIYKSPDELKVFDCGLKQEAITRSTENLIYVNRAA